jgi:hypothetical protein
MSACLLKHLSQDKLQVLELASRLECEIHLWAAAPAGSGDTPRSEQRLPRAPVGRLVSVRRDDQNNPVANDKWEKRQLGSGLGVWKWNQRQGKRHICYSQFITS